ncbi:MAG: ferredoxin [Deltaproteobacteria bacterium]|nr:MAG: ferredoxin [Deltaproteobacteria bacterium]
MKIIVDPEKCTGSGECVRICPRKAITLEDGLAVVDHDICDLDGICIPACPNRAIDYRSDG